MTGHEKLMRLPVSMEAVEAAQSSSGRDAGEMHAPFTVAGMSEKGVANVVANSATNAAMNPAAATGGKTTPVAARAALSSRAAAPCDTRKATGIRADARRFEALLGRRQGTETAPASASASVSTSTSELAPERAPASVSAALAPAPVPALPSAVSWRTEGGQFAGMGSKMRVDRTALEGVEKHAGLPMDDNLVDHTGGNVAAVPDIAGYIVFPPGVMPTMANASYESVASEPSHTGQAVPSAMGVLGISTPPSVLNITASHTAETATDIAPETPMPDGISATMRSMSSSVVEAGADTTDPLETPPLIEASPPHAPIAPALPIPVDAAAAGGSGRQVHQILPDVGSAPASQTPWRPPVQGSVISETGLPGNVTVPASMQMPAGPVRYTLFPNTPGLQPGVSVEVAMSAQSTSLVFNGVSIELGKRLEAQRVRLRETLGQKLGTAIDIEIDPRARVASRARRHGEPKEE